MALPVFPLFVRLMPVLALALIPGSAAALCDVTYKVQPGDTLFSISEAHYGARDRWTLIYYANQGVLTGGSRELEPGREVYIPCPAGDVAPDATPLRQADAQMTLLTGSNYSPFTDRAWPGRGMVIELVNAALELSPSPVPYSIEWEDDWSRHLFPMLDGKDNDMGFPWLRPDCEATPDNERCKAFHFSDPLMELPVMLFKRAASDFTYESDADIPGRTLCRPSGYFTHDLDRGDRRWLSGGKIELVRAESPEACFERLMAGDVDAVTVNAFLGASKIVAMGLRGKAVPVEKPLSHEALHVIISKTHWRGTAHLYRVNAGLRALRASGRYNEIVSKHLRIFWDQLN